MALSVLNNMKVSVLIITYNHEKYIAQAIDSVLMQDVNFPYEIVIGEDSSTDRTAEIVLEQQKKCPDRVRVMRPELAVSERERALGLGGKTNFIQCLEACRGEYVALLDGDDYWTSPHKLQKQVEFLESHPECAICFHNVEAFYEDQSGAPSKQCPPEQQTFSTLEDLIKGMAMPTCSVMFRRGLFEKLPGWFDESKVGDSVLHILNAQFGSAGYLNEVMAAYRVHGSGSWSGSNPVLRAQEMITFYGKIDEHLKFKYHRLIKRVLSKRYFDLALEYDNAGEPGRAGEWALRSVFLRPFNKDIPSRMRLKLLTKLCAPTAYRNLKSFLYGPLERNL